MNPRRRVSLGVNWVGERAPCSGAGTELRGGSAWGDVLAACLPACAPGASEPGSSGGARGGRDGRGEDVGRLVGWLDMWACFTGATVEAEKPPVSHQIWKHPESCFQAVIYFFQIV